MALLRTVTALVLLIGTLTLAPARLNAQGASSPEAMQAANELFALLSKDMMAQMSRQMTAQMWPLVEHELAGKVDTATQAQLRNEFERIQIENLADVLKDAPAIYARHFTAQELREIIAFNRSPTGQKALHEIPQVMSETIGLIMPRIPDVQTRTQEAFTKILRERGYLK